jgi:hypothetical protein
MLFMPRAFSFGDASNSRSIGDNVCPQCFTSKLQLQKRDSYSLPPFAWRLSRPAKDRRQLSLTLATLVFFALVPVDPAQLSKKITLP